MKLIPGMIFKDKKNGIRKTIIDVSGEQIYIKDHNGVRFMMGAWDFGGFNEFTGELDQELVPIGTRLIHGNSLFEKQGHSIIHDPGITYLAVYFDRLGGYCPASEVTLFLEEEDENI